MIPKNVTTPPFLGGELKTRDHIQVYNVQSITVIKTKSPTLSKSQLLSSGLVDFIKVNVAQHQRKDSKCCLQSTSIDVLNDCFQQSIIYKIQEVFTPKKHKNTGLPVTSREKVLQQCEQTQPISFTECICPSMLNKSVKIGEGVYGEVFRATNSKKESVAIKVHSKDLTSFVRCYFLISTGFPAHQGNH